MRCTVLMPMGGLGSRFKDAGWDTPKPLIEVDGKPMFLRALESFPSSWDTDYVFVIRQDQDREYGLGSMIERARPGARVAVLDHDTRGAVETCLEAKALVDATIPLIVADCDIRFRSEGYARLAEAGGLDGLLASFASQDARYSYAELDGEGLVVRTAEKRVISSHALLGGYWFGTGGLFFDLAESFLSVGLPEGLSEYYLSHLFNMMLADGGKVGLAEVDSYDIWGTPEELRAYVDRRDRS